MFSGGDVRDDALPDQSLEFITKLNILKFTFETTNRMFLFLSSLAILYVVTLTTFPYFRLYLLQNCAWEKILKRLITRYTLKRNNSGENIRENW